MKWKLETDVNYYVKDYLDTLGLEKLKDYNDETSMSDYMKEALKGSAKTEKKTRFGTPDFHVEKYNIPVIIENKLSSNKLKAFNKSGIKDDDKTISNYAVNGCLHYARNMIKSNKYKEVIAIGIAGDNKDNVTIDINYVFGSSKDAYKHVENYNNLNFLESKNSFEEFYNDAILTETEKHGILIDSRTALQKYAKQLNRLMHNHNITAPQRVLYVSGMLLAMQDINDWKGDIIQKGLEPHELKGLQTDTKRDGKIIIDQIKEYLHMKNIESGKMHLMLSSFQEISKDKQRDETTTLDKEVSKLLSAESSTNKQIFTFIYENIYSSIDSMTGHIDIMGEMYSEFLKYALGDGTELGIVLTPPYVTKMMAELLDVQKDSKVMDLATGSAGFLISSMELMIEQAELEHGKRTNAAEEEIKNIKSNNLLGIELNAEMYTLAATNMILRGDGSSNIKKANTFNTPKRLYEEFKATKLLLNPPFSYQENGMPFIEFGLNNMEKNGVGAIIIQDSAGTGKSVKTNESILKKHTLLASIKMPGDLFQPMAGVQTSIYIFEAKKPHDFDKTVKFIDFRNDGYKRTARGIQVKDSPVERYRDILKIYKAGNKAKVNNNLWNIDDVYIEDFIDDSGMDWNFDQHATKDTVPKIEDFEKTVSDYLSWEASQVLKGKKRRENDISLRLNKLEENFVESGGEFKSYRIGDLFKKIKTKPLKYKAGDLSKYSQSKFDIPALTAGIENQGLAYYVPSENATILSNVISVSANGANTGSMFYQPYNFTVLQDSYAIEFIENNINAHSYLYLLSSLNKTISNRYDWSNKAGWNRIKDELIILPTFKKEVCFEYMEKYIDELEADRIDELEEYLKMTRQKK
ncbi:N-6 DNA methylase [Staphylococcus kloosii]|uniref:N-6 DNA methylase n=1 Tax=Staphylococcus kloosii TaxID=29384 RepID=UPI0007DC1CC9|nr:N-6 DNA methylase [Staphylococcus kloosii]